MDKRRQRGRKTSKPMGIVFKCTFLFPSYRKDLHKLKIAKKMLITNRMLKQDLEDLLAEPFRSIRETIVGQKANWNNIFTTTTTKYI